MIGSFWNLCRACPSMPVDKQLHSEYRSTYRWHEFTGNSRPEVVRRAPAPNQSQFMGPTNEPGLPRRKKCPELAYKSHEFIIGGEYTDLRSSAGTNRAARSEERNGTPSRRSKSEGPPAVPNGRAFPIPTEVDGTATKQAGESNGLIKKTISKLSTEYRIQFVWPNVRKIKSGQESNDAADYPRKSLSMGAIRSQRSNIQQQLHHQTMAAAAAMPTVHKKRTTNQKEATLHELEPLVSDAEDRKPHEKHVTIAEKKVSARPFSQVFEKEPTNHFSTKRENFGFVDAKHDEVDNKGALIMNGTAPPRSQPNLDLWFKEMVELRKKAGEYKSRGWGVEINPEMYKKQKELWDQVSKRSSLSALSLASSMHRPPITKEEKEQENNKKSIPLNKTQKPRGVPGHAYSVDNKDEMTALPARFNNIRHHLERTTGPDVEEGALLPSPTREKLMPALTKRESESQRGSPKKTAASRHGSPQKGSPQKGSPKKVIKIRSQSVGPGVIENVSPKRQIRSASTAPTARYIAGGKKTPTAAAGTAAASSVERKTRPSTLSTTFHSRSKSSSLPPPTSGRAHSVPATNQLLHPNQSQSSQSNEISSKSPQSQAHAQAHAHAHTQPQSHTQPKPPQMRKKDKDKTNYSCISGGASGAGGAGAGVGGAGVQGALGSSSLNKVARPRPKSIIGSGATATAIAATATIGSAGKLIGDAGRGGVGGSIGVGGGDPNTTMSRLAVPGQDNKLSEYDGEDGRETAISISSCSPQPLPEVPDEPIVKSPPEPTRVKSPEQIIMRSPDPVNWTVPLDTGKTFTVTQNVKEGENYSRPQSEIKASTPVEKPPPPPQSAPPELTEQAKMDAWKHVDFIHDPKSSSSLLSGTSPTSATAAVVGGGGGVGGGKVTTSQPTAGTGGLPPAPITASRYEAKPVPGSTLRCLDDPIFDVDAAMAGVIAAAAAGGATGTGGANTSSSSTSTTTNTAPTARTTATDVLEKARDRFDRFWGGNKEDNV